MIAINLDSKHFQEDMKAILRVARRPRGILAPAARECANRLRSHFLMKDRTNPNKLGGQRQHIWQRIAHAVQAPIVEDTKAMIQIRDPIIAQKVFGGPIHAERVKNLAIPEEAKAYGRAPAVFERETGLKLILIKENDHAILATRIDPHSKALQVEYILTPSVNQEPDETALPPQDELEQAVLDRARKAMERQLKGGTPSE